MARQGKFQDGAMAILSQRLMLRRDDIVGQCISDLRGGGNRKDSAADS